MLIRFLAACLFCFYTGADKPDPLLLWNESPRLTWSDFKGAPPPNATNAALTSSGVTLDYTANGRYLTYKIGCHFDKSRSWGRVKNNLILAHEQGHFDLSEVYARRLHKALSHYRYRNSSVGDDVNRIYQNVMQELQQRQSLYDTQTDHSRNIRAQQEWLLIIQEELDDLEAYADYN
ncbi:MAG: DUF922 domain-containing protein [Williamsia sp.]|nr:DUF922 domain-containing protein [Williamsia sp.]